MGTHLSPTPGQTIGPFFAYGLEYPHMNEVVTPHSPGAIVLRGTIRDGAGAPIPDAMIEIFGADADGTPSRARGSRRRDGFTFTGFGRAFTDDEGRYYFWTREPGAGEASAAPFFAAIVYARGLPNKLHTRIYVPGHDDAGSDALAADPLLAALSPDERATLVARRSPEGHLVHDIAVQGEAETVFLSFSS